jgi:hypothetical protein
LERACAIPHGTASTEQHLAELKKWAETLPRTTNLVIYCGCCTFDRNTSGSAYAGV